MRVLLVSDAYPPKMGGATRAAQQLARHLCRRGHRVTVATASQRELAAYEDDEGVAVHRLRGTVSRIPALSSDPVRYTPPPFPDPELTWRLRRLIGTTRPEVVHSYGWLTYSCLAALWRLDVPLVLAAREYANVCAVRTLVEHGASGRRLCSGPAWAKCTRCAGNFYGQPKGTVAVASVLGQRRPLRRRVDALHSVSNFCERVVRRHLLAGRRIPARVLPDFRDDEAVRAPDAAVMERLPGEPFILFVGSFRRIKGDQLLIDAYRRLEAPPPLVMVGARSMEPMPDLPPHVLALVDVPHETVLAIWDRALFGVCPSLVSEALGNTVHEGMSRGKAVIGTFPGGHEDMIQSGHDGLLVPCGDVQALTEAMRQLIAQPELCWQMGERARHSAGRFTAQVVVPQIEAFLQEVARRSGGTRAVTTLERP